MKRTRWVAAAMILAVVLSDAGRAVAYPTVIPTFPEATGDTVYLANRTTAVSDDGRYVLWDSIGSMTTQRSFWTDSSNGDKRQLTDTFTYLAVDMNASGSRVLMLGWTEVADTRLRVDVKNPQTGQTTALAHSSTWGEQAWIRKPQFVGSGSSIIFGVATPNDVRIVKRTVSTGGTTTYPSLPIGYEIIEFSRDGRYVLIESPAGWVYRRTVATGVDEFVAGSVRAAGIGGDGRFVVADEDLFDMATGSSLRFVGQVGWNFLDPSGNSSVDVSDDGGVVAFATDEALVPWDTNGERDVYVWSRANGTHTRISLSDLGTQLPGGGLGVHLTPSGEIAIVDTPSDAISSRVTAAATGGMALLSVELGDSVSTEGVVDAALTASGGLLRLDRAGLVRATGGATAQVNCNGGSGRPFMDLGETASSISPTPSGEGYWIFTNRGRAVPCGDAGHFGDLFDVDLDGPVVDSVATPTGLGYYMVAADGGLFAFGDAVFHGSVPQVLPGVALAAPIVAITATDTNGGYRMLGADGGMFNFGDARYFGSIPEVLPGVPLAGSAVAMVASERGYLIVGSDGGIFNFGESVFHGSLGDSPPANPIGSVVVVPDLSGYVMFDENGIGYPFGTGDTVLD